MILLLLFSFRYIIHPHDAVLPAAGAYYQDFPPPACCCGGQ